MVEPIRKLGDLLLEKKLVTPEKLEEALLSQQQMGDRLGQILLCMRQLRPLALYRTLAEQGSAAFADLVEEPVDVSLSREDDLIYYLAYRCIPWKRDGDYLVLACTDLTPKLKMWAASFFAEPVRLAIATPRDLIHAIGQRFGHYLDEETRQRLLQLTPEFSAYHTLSNGQRVSLLMVMGMLAPAIYFFPQQALVALLITANLFYAGAMGLKWLLFLRRAPSTPATSPQAAIADAELPLYSVLIPLYKEDRIIPHLINAIEALDYPKTRLDVKLVVEEDDALTIEAVKQADPPAYMELVRVPYSLPRTKPKACNYALTFCQGEFVTIYDAEDRPAPDQLRKAVTTFRSAPENTVCLQAALNYYNRTDNWLTRLFAIEYSNLFDFMLPGLQRIGVPIPLGGTSNHIYLKKLRDLGEWDPYNVTEDADLGMRLAMHGYRTRMLDSVTMEEAPATLGAWIKQRSRWIKGYMQTWLVYMRAPQGLLRSIGVGGFWGFQFFIGGPPVVFLLSPLMWALCGCWLGGLFPDLPIPAWLLPACLASLATGTTSHVIFALASVRRWQWHNMTFSILLYPLYWALHSLASYRALWQLVVKPHYWDKTQHGCSQTTQDFAKETVDSPAAPR